MKIKTLASSSAGCCYVIESGGEQLLIECGIPLKKIREGLNFDLSKVVGCLISHEHKDHCKSFKDVSTKASIDCYVPVYMVNESTDFRFGFGFGVESDQVFRIGNIFSIKVAQLTHDVECFGYIVRTREDMLFYATDTGDLNYTIPGLTHLMIEANYSFDKLIESENNKSVIARVSENHLDIEQAIEFAKRHKNTLKEVRLLHLSDSHSDENEFKKMAQEALGIPVYVAKKGC